MKRFVAVAGALLALAGCSGSDEDDSVAAVRGYLSAFADGDMGRACDLLTPGTKKALTRVFGDEDCPAITGRSRAALGRQLELVDRADIELRALNSGEARARVSLAGRGVDVPLKKVDGNWRIDRLDTVSALFGLNP